MLITVYYYVCIYIIINIYIHKVIIYFNNLHCGPKHGAIYLILIYPKTKFQLAVNAYLLTKPILLHI